MGFVSRGEKELKSSYYGDTLEVGKEQTLRPMGLNGIKSLVTKKERKGIG